MSRSPFALPVRLLLDNVRRANFIPLHRLDVSAARAAYAAGVGAMTQPPPPVPRVLNFSMPLAGGARPARLWSTQTDTTRAQPVLLYLHGGGFVVGGLSTCDALCRELATASGAAVVAVDYRKCPEHALADAFDDAWHALQWLAWQGHTLGLDGQRLAVAGDSAGGTLAATVALMARDAGLPLALQAMFYPSVQTRLTTESFHLYGDEGLVDQELMAWFDRHAAAHSLPREAWHREPLFAPSHDRVAPAWIGLAECDMLTSEGQAYAHALEAAGVPVTLQTWPGMIHDFINMSRFLPAAREAQQSLAAALGQALGTRLAR